MARRFQRHGTTLRFCGEATLGDLMQQLEAIARRKALGAHLAITVKIGDEEWLILEEL